MSGKAVWASRPLPVGDEIAVLPCRSTEGLLADLRRLKSADGRHEDPFVLAVLAELAARDVPVPGWWRRAGTRAARRLPSTW